MNHFAVLTHILSNSTIDRFPVQNGQADWQITDRMALPLHVIGEIE